MRRDRSRARTTSSPSSSPRCASWPGQRGSSRGPSSTRSSTTSSSTRPARSRSRTLVLLGDAVQLAQVSQGTHPGGSGASVLEHLLGDAQTIPEDRGLFLERSFRMHPDVCRYISDAFYDSRLEAAEECAR